MKNLNAKVRLTYLCALLILTSCKKDSYTTLLSSEDSVIETAPPSHKPVSATVNNNCSGYYETLPSRYDSSTKRYPLILFIHGIGELGNGTTDLSKMIRAGLPRLINKKAFPADFEVNGKHYSFIVISPQFKKWPANADVNGVLQYALKKYRVDTSRIYVTGLSMGGGVTWEYSAQYGSSLAAIVPVCGGSWPDTKRAQALASFNLPVWAFHNNDDATVPVSYTLDYVSKINSFHPGVLAKATTWPTGGHDSWTKAYDPATKENGKNVYEWMLSYTRSGVK
jgi:predicted peptidase